jgi:hypothetical protein
MGLCVDVRIERERGPGKWLKIEIACPILPCVFKREEKFKICPMCPFSVLMKYYLYMFTTFLLQDLVYFHGVYSRALPNADDARFLTRNQRARSDRVFFIAVGFVTLMACEL